MVFSSCTIVLVSFLVPGTELMFLVKQKVRVGACHTELISTCFSWQTRAQLVVKKKKKGLKCKIVLSMHSWIKKLINVSIIFVLQSKSKRTKPLRHDEA